MPDFEKLKEICKRIRYGILISTTEAGSGHPTSSLSAVELAGVLFFGGVLKPSDKFILSKGHASPLLYSLYEASGDISKEELLTLRKFGSDLEGHPTPRFKYVDVATGSLGQGLSVGLGMALGLRSRVFVLLGDSEAAEGEVWEAAEVASYYNLGNLIGILDANRLGQRGETMLGWNLEKYRSRFESFGWETEIVDDGHDLKKVFTAFEKLLSSQNNKPKILIAKTVKGKGVSFLEDRDGWHGKAVPKDQLETALKELGADFNQFQPISTDFKPVSTNSNRFITDLKPISTDYKLDSMISAREAYGDALTQLGKAYENIVALDGEVSNSTYAEKFKKNFPERFFEMFIAEQNMVSAALGLSKVGFTPFVSTFAAFLTRAFDQIRMAQYSSPRQGGTSPNIKLVGSHAGVSIGEDGPSQMGLEDLAMTRAILESTVLYPADAVSTAKLTEIMAKNEGFFYLRTTREKTPVIYGNEEKFEIGGSKILRESDNDQAVVLTAGITLHEALKAYDTLKKEGVNIAVIDCYSIKPLDSLTIQQFISKAKNVVVVEDHYPAGGLGEAVLSAISNFEFRVSSFSHLCVNKIPRSGKPQELLSYEEIDENAIVSAVKKF